MTAYKTGAFVRSKYYTPFQKTRLKWIPRSKSEASKSRPRWAAHTRIGNVWEYLPAPRDVKSFAVMVTGHQPFAKQPPLRISGLRDKFYMLTSFIYRDKF